MDNFNSFFQTLSRGASTVTGPASGTTSAPAPAPGILGTAVTTTTTQRNSTSSTAAASPSSSSVSSLSSSISSIPGNGDGERASGTVAGMEVTTPAFTFSTPQGGLPHPQCTPIAFYNSDALYGSGRLIAVSDAFICYAIKDGHIRGINRQSVQRTLLKGHKKPVIDMAFARRSTCTLASLGGDGSFFLWTIGENPADKSLTTVPLLSVTNVHLQRIVWHPTKPHTVAVVAPNGEVALINTQTLIQKLGGKPGGVAPTLAATKGLDDLQPEWKLSVASNRCLDLSFSQDGKYIVTAGADGWARVWEVESKQAMGRWQPYGGEPVSRALFLHRTKGSSSGEKVFVVTGGKQASEVKLFRAWTTLSPINTQSLTFVPPPPDRDVGKGGRAFHLEADESGEFLLLADAVRPLLYAAHVVLGPSSAKVDRLTPFQLKHPVLSLLSLPGVAIDAHEGQADKTGASEVQLFCVQTQAIQIYHLKPEDCLAGSGSTITAPASLPSTTAAAAAPAPAPTTSARFSHQTTAAPPSGQSPAILQMLLQASQAAGSSGNNTTTGSSSAPGLLASKSLTASAASNGRRAAAGGDGEEEKGGRGEEAGITQAVAASLTEAKQTGGAQTTEEKGQVRSSREGRGLGSRNISAQRFATGGAGEESSGVGGGVASGQASRDATSGMGPVATVSPSEPASPSVPSPPPPPSSGMPHRAAVASGETSGGISLAAASAATSATVNTEVVLAGLRDMEHRLGQLLTQNTKKAVADAIAGMDKKIEKSIKAALALQLGDVSGQVKEAALAGLGDAVKEPMGASFKQCFLETLLPAMQNTTQRMFAQINDSINKNLPGAVTAAVAASGGGGTAGLTGLTEVKGEFRQVRSELASVANAVTVLSAQLAAWGSRLENGDDVMDLGGGLGGGAWRGKAAPAAAPAPAAPVISATQKEKMLRDLKAGKIDEVFVNVLSSQDLDLSLWLCSESPKDDIFDSEPPLLSQPTMFCLLQQLSFHLGQHTEKKLEWMQELVLAIDPSNSVVKSYIGEVCPELIQNFNEAAPEVVAVGHPRLVKDFKRVQKAIQNLARGT
ncbi:hypothetical protein VYU27_003477 [Nannochloropsis oceanica]